MIIRELKTDLVAEYFQFYLQDEQADENMTDAWTREAIDRLLALAPRTLGIGTVTDKKVPVTIKLFDTAPDLPDDLTPFAQLNECDLETTSTKLVVAGATDDLDVAKRIDVEKGISRVRIYYGNITTLSAISGKDFYEIHLWLVKEKKGLTVIRQKSFYL